MSFFEAVRVIAKIGSSLKSNPADDLRVPDTTILTTPPQQSLTKLSLTKVVTFAIIDGHLRLSIKNIGEINPRADFCKI